MFPSGDTSGTTEAIHRALDEWRLCRQAGSSKFPSWPDWLSSKLPDCASAGGRILGVDAIIGEAACAAAAVGGFASQISRWPPRLELAETSLSIWCVCRIPIVGGIDERLTATNAQIHRPLRLREQEQRDAITLGRQHGGLTAA